MVRLVARTVKYPHFIVKWAAERSSLYRHLVGRFLILAIACSLLAPQVARASSDANRGPESYGYFDFPTCVRYALVHSEDFLKNRIDVQVKSIDLKDAHSEVFPTVQVITRYYIDRAKSKDSTDNSHGSLSVSFFMLNWDIYVALLKIKSHSILVDIGQMSHFDKISENIGNMAKIFYRIHVLERVIKARKQAAALHKNRLDYFKTRLDQGAIDTVDYRSWANLTRNENLRIRIMEKELEERISSLKMLMGYQPDYYLPLDTRDAANQILGGFNGQMVSYADIQSANLSLQIAAKHEQLQSNRVTGSYVSLLPRPIIILEQIENQVDRASGFNFALGFDYTVWDGFRRVRDIRRQKLRAMQLKADRDQLSKRIYGSFTRLRDELGIFNEKVALEREQVRIAELDEERALLQYKATQIPYDAYVQKRIGKVDAYANSLTSLQERVQALIDLATIAGGLNRYNARIQY
ncbi:MAG: TolC family protein [Desulfomonile tiedjei]|uniref:TolC family protein n=1 Tax=Desulfomonile tiedjei TaxID=2358 RepID=A0A9D6V6N6_9BACT|nr:TolC family protein [Desulfomonile tiedjei]